MRLASFCSLLLCLVTTPALAELDSLGFGDGHSGALDVTTQRRVINVAVPFATGVLSGGTLLMVESTESFAKGDLVLVHQSAGFDSSTPSGGTGRTSPGGVGRWEFGRVARVVTGSPTEIHLTSPLAYSYTPVGAQVVRVPEYTTVNIAAGMSIVAPAWNGRSGGIVAFLATGAVTNNGAISADGAGFRGGPFVNHVSTMGCTGNDVEASAGGALKGEGVVVERYGTASGSGNLVNAGGGGNCHGSGGGGGGHRGVGGLGGRSTPSDTSRQVGGLGGVVMEYSLIDAALFGGGGGSGEGDDDQGSGGAAGGGLVLVRAASMSGSGRISANGASAVSAPGEDASGGGGAGGSVIARVAGTLQCSGMQANGGRGGDVVAESSPYGPGGGGGGGYLLAQGTTLACPTSVAPGNAGNVTLADAGTYGPAYGATAGGPGDEKTHLVPYTTPSRPIITSPSAGATGVPTRPLIEGTADPGLRVILYVDGAELIQVSAGADRKFAITVPSPGLSDGEHKVTARAEGLGAYSLAAQEVNFTVGAAAALVQPIIVVPEAGEVVGPTPLIAGVAPEAATVGIYLDDREEVIVAADALGRFRYQVPEDAPLLPGPHRVNAHAHSVDGDTGPSTPNTLFETVEAPTPPDAGVADAGTVDSGTPDAGGEDSGTPDAGGTDGGTQPSTPEAPVLVVPAEGEVVDPTPLFAGATRPGASVGLEVDGVRVATVVADAMGAFRYVPSSDAALAEGEHAVSVYTLVTNEPGPRSPDTAFRVRGPTNLDVGCGGCGASPAGMAGAWVLLVGWATLTRRRRR